MKRLIALVVFAEVVANSAWIAVSYDHRVRGNASLAYALSIAAGALSGWMWCYMAMAMEKHQMFVANMAWDVGVTIIFLSLPILFYGVRLDLQTCIGTTIAVLGLLIMK